MVVLNNGLGDHYAFKHILPELIEKYGKDNITIAVCYREVFKEYDIKLISIAEAQQLGDLDKYNVYKYMWDKQYSKSIVEAYREMYI